MITLVGAGRGPLIVCSLNAAQQTKREIVIYAIEKNPNAIQTLKAMHKQLQWGERVRIVEADMRLYQPEYYSDNGVLHVDKDLRKCFNIVFESLCFRFKRLVHYLFPNHSKPPMW